MALGNIPGGRGLMAGTVTVPVEPDASQFGAQLGRELDKQKGAIGKKLALWGAALTGAVSVGIHKTIKDATDLQESLTAVEFSFGSAAGKVLEWGKTTQDAFSQLNFNRAAKGFAVFARAAGLGDNATAAFAKSLIDAAQDLASFHDADVSDALQDMQSALTGLYRPLRKYAIVLSDAGLQQYALEKGITQGKEKLSDQEKILVRAQYILEKLGPATGDWARTMQNAANQERQLSANAADLSAQLGTELLPAYTKVLNEAVKFVGIMGRHKDIVKVVVIGLLALGVAMVAYAAGAKAAAIGTTILTLATEGLNAATMASGIGLIAVALVALGTAFVIAYQKSEKFRQIVSRTLTIITKGFGYLLEVVTRFLKVFTFGTSIILRTLGTIPKIGDKFDKANEVLNMGIDALDRLGDKLRGTNIELGKFDPHVKQVANNTGAAAVNTSKMAQAVSALQEKLTNANTGVSEVFGEFSSKALEAFDARTSEVLDNLSVKVQAYGKSWVMKEGDLTPAEKELAAIEKVEAARDRAAQKEKLREELRDARKRRHVEQRIGNRIHIFDQTGDKSRVKDIKEELHDIAVQERKDRLTERAKTERAAFDVAIETAKKEYTARRNLMKEHFSKELAALEKQVAAGKLSQENYRNQTLTLLQRYGVNLAQAGTDLGKAFSTGLIESMKAVEGQAKQTHKILLKILNLKNKIKHANDPIPISVVFKKGVTAGGRPVIVQGENARDKSVAGNAQQLFDVIGPGSQIIGQMVLNQTVTDESTAKTIGNHAARKVNRR